jgi:hypothetical protein
VLPEARHSSLALPPTLVHRASLLWLEELSLLCLFKEDVREKGRDNLLARMLYCRKL